MLRSIVMKVLHDQWRAVAVWTVLAGLLSAFYLSLYPSIGAVEEMQRLMAAMPAELRALFAVEGANLATPAGYLNMELFMFVLPLIVMALTLTSGGGATAGEEERGTLELLLANPVPRWRVVVEKALGGAILSAVLCAGVGVALAGTALAIDVELDLAHVAAGLVGVWLLGGVMGALALLVGALTGRRSLAIGIGLVVVVAAFFVNAMAPLSDVLRPWQAYSPYYHYLGYDPLSRGLDLGHAGVLAAMALLLTVLAAISFERRDLRG